MALSGQMYGSKFNLFLRSEYLGRHMSFSLKLAAVGINCSAPPPPPLDITPPFVLWLNTVRLGRAFIRMPPFVPYRITSFVI